MGINKHLIIKPLSPSLIDDYLLFFDGMAFSENPHWSKCYCYSYHFTGAKEDWTREKNRSAVIELISREEMKGFLAFDNHKAVGWCNANRKSNFQSLTGVEHSESHKCAIVCFLISPAYRRQGIAQKLLEAVIDEYTSTGYESIEAYPRKDKHSCEKNYHGHLSMYEKFGFKVEKEFDDHFVLRKKL